MFTFSQTLNKFVRLGGRIRNLLSASDPPNISYLFFVGMGCVFSVWFCMSCSVCSFGIMAQTTLTGKFLFECFPFLKDCPCERKFDIGGEKKKHHRCDGEMNL